MLVPVCARCGEITTDMLAHFDCRPAEPLTDEEVGQIAARIEEQRGTLVDRSSSEGGPQYLPNPLAQDARRLVAEVRRLRLDAVRLKAHHDSEALEWGVDPERSAAGCTICRLACPPSS